jgi:hypothetical protein
MVIQLTSNDLLRNADQLVGQRLDYRHYDRLITNEAVVLKPNGDVLAIYVREAIPRALCHLAFDVFNRGSFTSNNRSVAAGGRPSSGYIAGFFDAADPRMPFGRMTAWTREHYKHFRRARPFIEAVDDIYRKRAPEHWERQREFIDKVLSDFRLWNIVFTTVTVNRSFRTRAHRDEGDYRNGLGVIAVMQRGQYDGCELIFPKFRTAFDLRTGGILLCDVHELHGNGPLIPRSPSCVRLSFVFYAREQMTECKLNEA